MDLLNLEHKTSIELGNALYVALCVAGSEKVIKLKTRFNDIMSLISSIEKSRFAIYKYELYPAVAYVFFCLRSSNLNAPPRGLQFSNGGFISHSKHFSFYIFDQYLTLSNLTVQYGFCLASNLMLVLNGIIFPVHLR